MNDMTHDHIRESVLERIEREGIKPHSRWYWLTQEYGLWTVWAISVVLGSLALAVVSFSSLYIGYALYEATHDNFLTFLLDTMPYLWFLAFAALMVAAHFNLRRTKKGYRYSPVLVTVGSLGFSVLGALFLHFFGAGYYLDYFLGRNLDSYQSRAEFESLTWQNPLAGRLIGAGRAPDPAGIVSGVIFTDINDKEWQLLTNDLNEHDDTLIRSGQKVRVLMATSSEQHEEILVVCGVFPWMWDEVPAVAKWREDRRAFVDNIQHHRGQVGEVVRQVEREIAKEGSEEIDRERILEPTGTSSSAIALNTASGQPSPCAQLPVFGPVDKPKI
jgi:hypothetical protein